MGTKRYNGFEKINKVITRQDHIKKIDESFWRYKALNGWEKAVVAFFAEAGNFTKALDFKKGVLIVACLKHELAYRIRLLSEQIITTLNQLLGRRVVFSLVVEE